VDSGLGELVGERGQLARSIGHVDGELCHTP
jgi:hypothetical protein